MSLKSSQCHRALIKTMFQYIKELVEKLSLEDKASYVQCKKARRILQEIKTESQKLRNKITEDFKSTKGIKHKITKEEIVENNLEGKVEEGDEIEIPGEEIEEPKLVDENDDDFFDRQ